MSFQVLFSEKHPSNYKSALKQDRDITKHQKISEGAVQIQGNHLTINGKKKDYSFDVSSLSINHDEISFYKSSKLGFGLPINKVPLLELTGSGHKIYLWNFEKPTTIINLRNQLQDREDLVTTPPANISGIKFTILLNFGAFVISLLGMFWLINAIFPEISEVLDVNIYLYGTVLAILVLLPGIYFLNRYRTEMKRFDSWLNRHWS